MNDNIDHTILIVDDEEEMTNSLKRLLEKNNFQPVVAEDGRRALQILKTRPVGLVLSDIRMPGMSGLEFMEQALSLQTVPSFIFMTAYASVETAVEALRMGAVDYIIKPFKLNELMLVINEHLPRFSVETSPFAHKVQLKQFLKTGNPIMKNVLNYAKKFSKTDMPVLIQGSSGTGKELLAEYIHSVSNRKNGPFIRINCANLSENILESELFGHEKGAYTGSQSSRKGRFELANGGTLFFDEIGDMAVDIQAKLLRVLQEGEFYRLGGNKPIYADVRIIAATNKDITELVEAGHFREDVYFRLEGTILQLPALSERHEDIPSLIDFFLKRYSHKYGKQGLTLSGRVAELFMSYSWPGNIRELKNCIERCVVVCDEEEIDLNCIQGRIRNLIFMKNENASSTTVPCSGREGRQYINDSAVRDALRKTGGSRTKAARLLKISRKTLYNKMKEYDIAWPFE